MEAASVSDTHALLLGSTAALEHSQLAAKQRPWLHIQLSLMQFLSSDKELLYDRALAAWQYPQREGINKPAEPCLYGDDEFPKISLSTSAYNIATSQPT
jgi:hypothetical protein